MQTKQTKNEKALNIKIPEKLYEELKTSAQRKNISLASVVRILCSEGIENEMQSVYEGSRGYISDKRGKYITYGELLVKDSANADLYIPKKERLIVERLRNFIENDTEYTIALVAGIRKVGKTTVLKQLLRYYGNSAMYVDLLEYADFMDFMDEYAENPVKILLLDEITYLDDFEDTSQQLYNLAARHGLKIIMTGSSSAHITKLSWTKLGGGRARLFRLPPITFIEYLYLTDKIKSYDNYENVKNSDFADYLMLKELSPSLRIQFDNDYFNAFYNEVNEGNEARGLSHSLVPLSEDDLLHMSNLIAYKLGEAVSYDKSIGDKAGNKIGKREYNSLNALPDVKTQKWSKIDLSDAFITESYAAAQSITPQDKARILSFMLWAGLANIEIKKKNDDDVFLDAGSVLSRLKDCFIIQDLRDLFNEVSICFTTPLFYTRLGIDIVSRMNINVENLCRGELLGKMLEVYIRGAVTINSAKRIMSSAKLDYVNGSGEVDIYDEFSDLLLEITCSDKKASDIHLQNYMKDLELIRICSTDNISTPHGCYHRIPYAKLCCMFDTGDVYKLQKTKANDIIEQNL